jgi:hypothetical protein
VTTLDIKTTDGRREAWVVIDLVGGYVCAEPDPAMPDGICGMPVESEPCTIHHPDDPSDQGVMDSETKAAEGGAS